MDIYKAARERIAADFDKSLISAPRPSDTAELRERQKLMREALDKMETEINE